MKSIICNEKECFLCGSTRNLEKHHCFAGGRRKNSEKYGAWVWLCNNHHTGAEGVHTHNFEADEFLKVIAQRELENIMTRDEFRQHFGASHLD